MKTTGSRGTSSWGRVGSVWFLLDLGGLFFFETGDGSTHFRFFGVVLVVQSYAHYDGRAGERTE
jgi:hypothetical protein